MFQTENSRCRFCDNTLKIVKNLGNLGSCGTFLEPGIELFDSGDLKLAICDYCGLVQLEDNFNQASLYNEDYGYNSSLNSSMVSHLLQIAQKLSHIAKQIGLKQVKHLDIGSNDATLINLSKEAFEYAGCVAVDQLGIDPSAYQHQANYRNSNLLLELFTYELSENLTQKFDVITSIAMLYDLPNPKNFFSGVKNILEPHGVWITEQSYIFSMVEQNAFDTICHEHLEYYSVQDIDNLCRSVGLEIFDVEFNEVNGGSFRLYIQHQGGAKKISEEIPLILASEKKRNKSFELEEMFNRVEILKMQTLNFLQDCKYRGREVHGYGASTKGNTLLQYYGITNSEIKYIAEVNKNKFGKMTPGSKIPIISEELSKSLKPFAYLILPWHFSTSILEKERDFINVTGTRFGFPLPEWKLV